MNKKSILSSRTGNRIFRRGGVIAFAMMGLLALPMKMHAQHKWETPTPEELSMKSIPEVPGAAAVILDYDEVDDDMFGHSRSVYERIKVLTEAGKSYADVKLEYDKDIAGLNYAYSDFTGIDGRTIEPDGTIVPFTGKPYEKTETKTNGYDSYKIEEKVFTLPDVRVGSILEFRFTYNYEHNLVMAPTWTVQRELFVKHATYTFQASDKEIGLRGDGGDQLVEWVPHIPSEWKIEHTGAVDGGVLTSGHGNVYTLEVKDVMPTPDEPYLPPIGNMTYRVDFYYFGYKNLNSFWAGEGKYYSGLWNKFMSGGLEGKFTGGALKNAANGLVAPGDSEAGKAKKIYDAVQALDNTDYTRQHTEGEDKAQGLHDVNAAMDVWNRKRGTGDELAMLYVAMAREAGLKAYLMDVTPRDKVIFDKSIANWSQMTHMVAIVNVGGTETFLDPGVKYCKFGELAWDNTEAAGVRQTDGGTEIAQTPFMNYKESSTQRAIVISLDDHGVATGQVQEVFEGEPALEWRQKSLEGDGTSMRTDLVNDLKDELPGGMEVNVAGIMNVNNPDQPLVANFAIKGPVGTVTGKRMLVLGDLFQTNEKPLLTGATRQSAVYLRYNRAVVDLEQIKLPPSMQLDTVPDAQDTTFKNQVVYKYSVAPTGNTVLVKRIYVLGDYVFPPAEYNDVRAYYGKMTQADQSVILIKTAGSHGN